MVDSKRRTKEPGGQEKTEPDVLSKDHREALGALAEAKVKLDQRLGDQEVLASAEDLARARDVLLKATSVIEVGERTRADATLPYRKKSDAVVALFRPVIVALGEVKARAQRLVTAYMLAEHERQQREAEAAERERREAEERQRAAERAARQEADPDRRKELQAEAAQAFLDRAAVPEPPREIAGARGVLGSLFVEEGWDYEVVDLDLVPREYLTVDGDKVRAAADEAHRAGGKLEVPGLRILPANEVRKRRASGR